MSAILSPCRRYRYRLTRSNDESGVDKLAVSTAAKKRLLWVMLNPSTADETQDDPTIRKCMGFAQRQGFEVIEVVNLFAFRATNPRDLLTADDPVGPDNDAHILAAASRAHSIVCAWGTKGSMGGRDVEVIKLLAGAGYDLHNLELTKHGHPKHPLYISYSQSLQLWPTVS